MLFNFTSVRRYFILICASFVLSSGLLASTARVESCSTCYSSASFLHHAEQSSLSSLPGFEGIDPVYVFNYFTGQIKFFHVDRWIDNSFQPHGTSPPEAQPKQIIDQRILGYFRAEATELPGNPLEMADISDGINTVFIFSQYVASGIHIDELPEVDLPSAVSLIGPYDSPAGANRIALQNALNNQLSTYLTTLRIGAGDFADRALKRVIGDSHIELLSELTIQFGDGTSIRVEITRILADIESGVLGFMIEILTETAQGPGMPVVPQAPGHFHGFYYAGSDTTLAELALLAQMFGIPVVAEGSGGGGCRMSCEVDGDAVTCRISCSPN